MSAATERIELAEQERRQQRNNRHPLQLIESIAKHYSCVAQMSLHLRAMLQSHQLSPNPILLETMWEVVERIRVSHVQMFGLDPNWSRPQDTIVRYVICSAIKRGDKVWYGRRHGDVIRTMTLEGCEPTVDDLLGFVAWVDGVEQFVTRKVAAKIAYQNNQILGPKEEECPDTLCSEDLY